MINILIIAAGLGLAAWVGYRLLRWARAGGSGTHILGSVLTEITQGAAVREAKEDQRRKNADAGPAGRRTTDDG